MFRETYAGTKPCQLPKAELRVTEILSIEFWAAASEVTPIYYSKCYLHNISTARAHNLTLSIPLLQYQVFGPLHHGLTVTEPQLTVLPSLVNFG